MLITTDNIILEAFSVSVNAEEREGEGGRGGKGRGKEKQKKEDNKNKKENSFFFHSLACLLQRQGREDRRCRDKT